MKEDSEQKLVVFEDDSCMEVPDSDGENMPDNKNEFNTNNRMYVTNRHMDGSNCSTSKAIQAASFVSSSFSRSL